MGTGEAPAALNSPSWIRFGKGYKPHANVHGPSVVCVCLSCQCLCIVVCVTSAGNESHPPIADEDKGTDRLYMLAEGKTLDGIQML